MQTIARRKIAQHAADELLAGTSHKQLATKLAAYLADSGSVALGELLIRDIEVALTRRGTSVLHVTSARQLTEATRTALMAAVQQQEGTKHAVIASEAIDPELIGGVHVRTAESVMDGSVRGSLQGLKRLSKQSTN